MDRRSKRTKNAIYHAFTELMLKEKYTKITVQEIIDQADIGRSTFYSYFETKDELLKSMCTDLFDEMHQNSQASPHGKPDAMLLALLNHIKERDKMIKGVFSSDSGELFMNYFKDYFSGKIELYFLTSYDEKATGIPKAFLINHIYSSFLEMVKWWVSTNMKQTPQELMGYFRYVISPVIVSETKSHL